MSPCFLQRPHGQGQPHGFKRVCLLVVFSILLQLKLTSGIWKFSSLKLSSPAFWTTKNGQSFIPMFPPSYCFGSHKEDNFFKLFDKWCSRHVNAYLTFPHSSWWHIFKYYCLPLSWRIILQYPNLSLLRWISETSAWAHCSEVRSGILLKYLCFNENTCLSCKLSMNFCFSLSAFFQFCRLWLRTVHFSWNQIFHICLSHFMQTWVGLKSAGYGIPSTLLQCFYSQWRAVSHCHWFQFRLPSPVHPWYCLICIRYV